MNTFIQLLEEAQNNKSGFSFNPNQVNPTTGYMVALYGHEMGCGKDVLMTSGIRYYQEHQEMMALNSILYIGCWFQNDMFYFDLSENVQTLEIAMHLAENNMQLAVWDCANQEEIRTTLRQCACCGKRSSHGYVFNQGEDYTCDDTNCRDHVSNNMYGAEWDELCEYQGDSFYYTEHAADYTIQKSQRNNNGSELYAKQRLEELRLALRSESISYGELLELQCLSPYIDKGDVELLEASGVEESN